MSVRCLITEGKNYEQNKQFVEDTLKYFPDYDFNIMKATISGWQSSQLKDNEDRLPTIQELISYLQNSAKRENNNNIKVIADKAQQILNNLSTYNGELQDILANAPRDSQGRLLAPNAIKEGYDGVIYRNIYDMFLADSYGVFNPNQIKSATDNIGAFSTKDDNIYNSDTIEEYETVASIGDYIQSYSPEDRAEIAREINNGNISIKCK